MWLNRKIETSNAIQHTVRSEGHRIGKRESLLHISMPPKLYQKTQNTRSKGGLNEIKRELTVNSNLKWARYFCFAPQVALKLHKKPLK